MEKKMRGAWKSGMAVVALILVSTGCDAIFGDGYDVRVEMDDDAYTLALSTEMKVTIDNRSDHEIYYLCGGEVFIDRYVNGDSDGSFGFPNCDCLCPNPIEAGETEKRTYPIDEYLQEWIRAFDGEGEVTYRFRLVMYEDSGFDRELDRNDQESDEFLLVESVQ